MNKKVNPTDRFLIIQYRDGNTSMLPALVKRYHRIFCEKAYWITKDKETAKDVAQECWIIIIHQLDSLKDVDSFKNWAFRIVYTKAIDAVNNRNRERKNVKSIEITKSGTQPYDDARTIILKALLNAIQKLPKEKQDIIRLFYIEGYSINEISNFLNIPIGTVKSRLFNAREKLKSIKKVIHEK